MTFPLNTEASRTYKEDRTPSQKVEAPVAQIEEDEEAGESNSRAFIDAVHVFDARQSPLQFFRPDAHLGHEPPLPLPVGRGGGGDGRAVGERSEAHRSASTAPPQTNASVAADGVRAGRDRSHANHRRRRGGVQVRGKVVGRAGKVVLDPQDG